MLSVMLRLSTLSCSGRVSRVRTLVASRLSSERGSAGLKSSDDAFDCDDVDLDGISADVIFFFGLDDGDEGLGKLLGLEG